MAESGIRKLPDGTQAWEPAFPGQRPPLQPGHTLSLKHGARATVSLGPRVEELADLIRPLVPGYSESDEIALRLLCLALARLEKSSAALAELGPVEMARLRDDERGWANTTRRILTDLGLTPSGRAALGLTVVRAKGEALRAHLVERYADTEGEEP